MLPLDLLTILESELDYAHFHFFRISGLVSTCVYIYINTHKYISVAYAHGALLVPNPPNAPPQATHAHVPHPPLPTPPPPCGVGGWDGALGWGTWRTLCVYDASSLALATVIRMNNAWIFEAKGLFAEPYVSQSACMNNAWIFHQFSAMHFCSPFRRRGNALFSCHPETAKKFTQNSRMDLSSHSPNFMQKFTHHIDKFTHEKLTHQKFTQAENSRTKNSRM